MKSLPNTPLPPTFGDPRPRRAAEREAGINFSSLDRTLIDEPVTEHSGPVPVVTRPVATGPLPGPVGVAVAEPNPAAVKALGTRRWITPVSLLIGVLTLAVLAEAGFIAVLMSRRTAAIAGTEGTIAIDTAPAGARVFVNDTDQGVTPLKLSLPAGAHRVAVVAGAERRELDATIAAGSFSTHRIEFAPASVTSAAGDLEIRTRPSGASVVIAGSSKGRTPLTIRGLQPGNHEVLLSLGGQQLRESVAVTPGATAQLSAAFPATSANRASGWVAITAPVELTILEQGQVIGTTRSARIMLPAGRHSLELVNERLGFRASRVVDVVDGKTATFTPELPRGTVSVNALPWAEVWLEERKVGDTPLANLSLRIGTHQLLFRHPSFGERRQDVTITAGAPARVSVDMRR